MIVKLAFAFGAGFISFLTPCVLPIIPGYISYITGKNLDEIEQDKRNVLIKTCLLYTSPSPRDRNVSRMPSSA